MVEVSPVRTYETPTRLVHGIGALSTLGQEARALGITRPLLATDQGIVKAGIWPSSASSSVRSTGC